MDDLRHWLSLAGVDRTVLVEAGRCSADETDEFLATASETPEIAGVVGWASLTDPALRVNELVVTESQLPSVEFAASAIPSTFVLDHLGKPHSFEPWRVSAAQLAALPNVVAKLRWRPSTCSDPNVSCSARTGRSASG